MSILPVIDLKGGLVVRGVAGRRDEYQPVDSVLTGDPSPASIARALRERLHCDDVYVADLDAIGGQGPSWADYAAIASADLKLWVDAGIADGSRSAELANAQVDGAPLHRIIIALETLRNASQLAQIVKSIGVPRAVFSLDLKNNQPLAASPRWSKAEPIDIAAEVIDSGIQNLIVLDLAQVGIRQGTGTSKLCREIKRRWPQVRLIGGGGVNSIVDVERLGDNGLHRVLVASALHDGRIDTKE